MHRIEYPNKLSNALRWLYKPYAFLDEAAAAHGPTFRMALPGAGNVLVTGDPDMIREIAANRNLVAGKGVKAMRPLFGGDSLMMLDGEAHRSHRQLLTPPFQKDLIVQYDDLTVSATLDAIRQIPVGEPFSMFEVLRKITQKIIVCIVFGVLPPEEEAQALHLIHAFMTSFDNPLTLYLKPLHVNLGRHSPWGRITLNRANLRGFILGQIKRFELTADNENSLLAYLIAKGGMPEPDMVTEIFGMLMFGHDTTAVAMAWVFAHLYSHPDIVRGLAHEANHMPLLGACIQESARLSPTVVQLLRAAAENLQVGGQPINKGEMVMPCLYLAHRNPAVFPKPGEFIPGRFMQTKGIHPPSGSPRPGGNPSPPGYGESPPPDAPHAYFPFGFGSRLCVGKPLAERQMPLIISTIYQNISLSLATSQPPEPVRYMVFIAPSGGTKMVRKS